MSLLRQSFSSLFSNSRRIPTLASSRLCGVRTNTSRAGNNQNNLPNEGPSNAKAYAAPTQQASAVVDIAGDLEDIADQIDAAKASGYDAVTLTPEANATADDEQPPRAPNSEEHAKSEELRKQSKRPKDGREDSPFAVRGLYRLSAQCSNNNTILTLGDHLGKTVYQVSSGMCGFKHVQRSTYEAGYQCAVRMFEKIEAEQKREGTVRLEIFFKGRGMGREALQKALMMSEGDVVRKLVAQMTDRTAIKIGGQKAKKARRL